ncbi:MAG: hypothetical protein KBT20_05030 [Bacteroidales bacterium]|nr:hypothetical protein [Candidatus Liminaster caballi]
MKGASSTLICKILSFLLLPVLCSSCSEEEGEKGFDIRGVWELQQMLTPTGHTYAYPEQGSTWMRIYTDTCCYICQIASAPNGTMVTPAGVCEYTFIEKGQNEVLYLQGNDVHPLTIINDSTMVIQDTGCKYTWALCRDFDQQRCNDIEHIVRFDAENPDLSSHRYVFSKAERQLQRANDWLSFMLLSFIVAFILFINFVYHLYQNKKRVEQELRRIEQERKSIPEPVRQAMDSVEAEFHKSEFYLSLRRRIANGERLKKDDWDAVDAHFKSVYPRFTGSLMSLHNMSQVEYQVCLLLKLNVTPSEIASVLCKDASSISTTRSRLYQKVFGKKGSSKDWDEFIHSL